MELTEEQIKFLDKYCGRNYRLSSGGVIDTWGLHLKGVGLTEIPVKFYKIYGNVDLSDNKLTSLESFEGEIKWGRKLYVSGNNLTDYFKTIKRKDFKYWGKLEWAEILNEYPFMINRAKSFITKEKYRLFLDKYPLTKIYYKD